MEGEFVKCSVYAIHWTTLRTNKGWAIGWFDGTSRSRAQRRPGLVTLASVARRSYPTAVDHNGIVQRRQRLGGMPNFHYRKAA